MSRPLSSAREMTAVIVAVSSEPDAH